jgi:hypothetical protein
LSISAAAGYLVRAESGSKFRFVVQHNKTKLGGLKLRALVILMLFAPSAIAADLSCNDETIGSGNERCDVRRLKPLQGALGMVEVRAKASDIIQNCNAEWKHLSRKPIEVIKGPDSNLYIVDHHHGAAAWLLAGHPQAQCVIVDRKISGSKDEFLAELEKGCEADPNSQAKPGHNCKVHLEDKNGNKLAVGRLPDGLAQMGDDPYRSLAWYVRNAGGFCRSDMNSKDFAEFVWADWLRPRVTLPANWTPENGKTAANEAMELVTSDVAKNVPGWVGKNPSHKCAD